jgi:cell division protein FtsB
MESEPKPRPERKRTGQLSGIQIMFAAILAIGLILGLNFTTLISSGQPLQDLYRKVSDEIDQLKKDQADLLKERDYAKTSAYVEAWARNEGRMVKPGEVLVIPVPSNTGVTPTPMPTVEVAVDTRPQSDNWTVWWSLFFDSPPPK